MSDSEFPLKKTNGRYAELDARGPQRLSTYQRYEPSTYDAPNSRGYDSLLEYWHILFRHRMTLLRFVGVGLVGAILNSDPDADLPRANFAPDSKFGLRRTKGRQRWRRELYVG